MINLPVLRIFRCLVDMYARYLELETPLQPEHGPTQHVSYAATCLTTGYRRHHHAPLMECQHFDDMLRPRDEMMRIRRSSLMLDVVSKTHDGHVSELAPQLGGEMHIEEARRRLKPC